MNKPALTSRVSAGFFMVINMRYIYLLLFLVLALHSHLVFSQYVPVCHDTAYSSNHCNNVLVPSVVAPSFGYCEAHPSVTGYYKFCRVPKCPSPLINSPTAPTTCVCPAGQAEYTLDAITGAKTCGPICVSPQIANIVTSGGSTTVSCIDPPDEGGGDDPDLPCDESEKVFDPVTSTMVCPGSGDEPPEECPSGFPPVNGECPVCIGGQNPDGTCQDDSPSSTPTSQPTSPPSSIPNTSSPNTSSPSTGGGDDNPDNPDTGAGGNNGGSNTGGGSASSAASSSPSSTGSNSSASSGECDPRSKTYFSCITSQKITPEEGDIPWVPNSGYGNWIPVAEDSPCPNKYRDAEGQWWCSGGGGATGGSTGSAASGGAGSSASGKCDPTAENYLACISGQVSSNGSSSQSSINSSSSSRSGAFSSLGERGEFDDELHEKRLEDLTQELEDKIADIKEDVAAQIGGTISGNGGIQDFCKNIRSNDVCFGMKKFEAHLDPISNAIFLVCCVLAFVIVLRN